MRASRVNLVPERPWHNRRRGAGSHAGRRDAARGTAAALGMLTALAALAGGCARERAPAEPRHVSAASVFADTGRGIPLAVVPPRSGAAASVWMERVSPARIARARASLETPAPEAPPETLASQPAVPAPGLASAGDDELKSPILRERGRLDVPARAMRVSVELDVRVDEEGRVSDASWAAGSEDSTLVRAAIECALGMRFFPALHAGRPIAVWCRQRFDFGTARRR